jgi:hypothetical protein
MPAAKRASSKSPSKRASSKSPSKKAKKAKQTSEDEIEEVTSLYGKRNLHNTFHFNHIRKGGDKRGLPLIFITASRCYHSKRHRHGCGGERMDRQIQAKQRSCYFGTHKLRYRGMRVQSCINCTINTQNTYFLRLLVLN